MYFWKQMKQNNIRGILEKHPVIPVITFQNLDEVIPQINRLRDRGVFCIEITLRTPIAFDAIKLAKSTFTQGFDVGVGTVINQTQIELASKLKVDFMVSPGLNPDLAAALENSGVAFIPGVATPGEIMKGLELGWDTFKFFPAHLFGGYEALKTYGQVFPQVKFCPTGGIKEETHQSYLALDNVMSVGGSWLK